ncbi:MAG: SDR family NAD(P)-dependent oxidoreductase [Solirubrobacteraceae bacterium]|nr:SDR family NAD(P)-dependent oxidoreductase [Solirubrobacteraceae bacterium]
MSPVAATARKVVRRALPRPRGVRGAVVVTGASSGIGEATALHLASLGYRVLAGVRSTEDFERLRKAAPGIEPIMLDVTDDNQINSLVELIDRTEPGGLHGLVNNAGVGVMSPIEALQREQWQWVLGVNVIGMATLTTALLPSLIRGRGRVIGIGSGAGRMAFPLFAPYATSKFALEAFTDTLRREVGPHGVKVVNVQPGIIATPMYDKGLPEAYALRDRLDPTVAERYRRLLDSALGSAEEATTTGRPPIEVAEAVARALADRWPKTRYVVGWDARTAVICARILPDRVADMIISRLTRD